MRHIRMKLLRKERHLTQEKLAEIIDVSMNHYGKYERGEVDIPLSKAMELCELYHVSLDYLVGWSDDKNGNNKGYKERLVEKLTELLDTI